MEVEFAILGRVHEGRPLRRSEHQRRTGAVLAVPDGDALVKESHLDTVVSAVAVAAAGLLPDRSGENCSIWLVREQLKHPPSYAVVFPRALRDEQALDHLDGHSSIQRPGAQTLELLPVTDNLGGLLLVVVSRKTFKIDNIQMGGLPKLQKGC